MNTYPVNLRLHKRKCAVVGGGTVAGRKIRSLLECGARVEVVSPESSPEIRAWARAGKLAIRSRGYEPDCLNGCFLVVAATNDPSVNRKIAEDAGSRGILCNVADQPELSDFTVPAVARKGPISVAVSTEGKSPALARRLKELLVRGIPSAYVTLAELLGALRLTPGLAHGPASEHKKMYDAILESDILEKIEAGDVRAVESIVGSALGENVTLGELGIDMENGSAPV